MREICCSFGVIDQLPNSADAEISFKIGNSPWAICVPVAPDPIKNSRPAAQARLSKGRNPRWGDANVSSFKWYYWVTISVLGCLMKAGHQQPHVCRHWRKVEIQTHYYFRSSVWP